MNITENLIDDIMIISRKGKMENIPCFYFFFVTVNVLFCFACVLFSWVSQNGSFRLHLNLRFKYYLHSVL